MEQYKVGETVWVLHQGQFKREIVQVKISKVDIAKYTNHVVYIWYYYNDELEGVQADKVDIHRDGLIYKLMCENTRKFNDRTNKIRDEIKALNDKMLLIQQKYEADLDFLNAQKEDGDGN